MEAVLPLHDGGEEGRDVGGRSRLKTRLFRHRSRLSRGGGHGTASAVGEGQSPSCRGLGFGERVQGRRRNRERGLVG